MFQEVGDRIFRRRYERLDQNIGVVIGSESVCVIDSRSNHPDADEFLDELRTLTALPIRFLVNTHMHWDHTFGNARFTDATIVGHHDCRRRLVKEGEDARSELLRAEWVPQEWKAAFREVEITPPTVTFVDRVELHLDDRLLELRYLGRGHTDNDIVVIIDDACFVGDLVEEGSPPSFGDSYPDEWVSTLDRLLAEVPPTVVPGHGDLVDQDFVRAQRDDISEAVRVVAEGRETGPWSAEVMASIASRMPSR